VFAVTTLPLSVVRWKSGFGSISHHYHTATFVVEFFYSLSGAFNVLLFLFTRSDLLLPHNRLGVAPGPMPPNGQAGFELTPIIGADDTNLNFPRDGRGATPSPTSPHGQTMLGVTPTEPLPGLDNNPRSSRSGLRAPGSASPDDQIEVEPIPGDSLPRVDNEDTSHNS